MQQIDIDEVIWFQQDAAHCYSWAQQYRDNPAPGYSYVATRVQQAAANSAAIARALLGVVEG